MVKFLVILGFIGLCILITFLGACVPTGPVPVEATPEAISWTFARA